MAEPITIDEVLAELERLGGTPSAPNDGYTAAELAKHWGTSPKGTLAVIKRLIEAGLAEPARCRRVDMVGRNQVTFGYRLVKPVKVEKKRR